MIFFVFDNTMEMPTWMTIKETENEESITYSYFLLSSNYVHNSSNNNDKCWLHVYTVHIYVCIYIFQCYLCISICIKIGNYFEKIS